MVDSRKISEGRLTPGPGIARSPRRSRAQAEKLEAGRHGRAGEVPNSLKKSDPVILDEQFHNVLEAAGNGEEWAWASLYREVAPVVLRYLRARGAPEAEDLLGEVMLKVVRKLPGFVGGEPEFRAWVLTIARNRLIDEGRRSARRRVEPAPDELLLRSAPVGDAEQDALRALTTQRVRSVLDRLSTDQRDVLLLRILGRLTIEEVARVLGKRPGAVKALQVRGLAALRRAISTEAVSL